MNGIMNLSTPMAAQTMLLSVDSYRERAIENMLWCLGEEGDLLFCNLMQMVLNIETLLNCTRLSRK